MKFRAIRLQHGERVQWDRITHVRVKEGAVGDTLDGQRILDHIRKHSVGGGPVEIARIKSGFPARQNLAAPLAMRRDLRHMANQRHAGESQENKGLLEIGWME